MKKNKFPKASIALIIAAVLLLGVGGGIATFAAPDILSESYESEFEMDSIDVALVENGTESKEIKSKALLESLNGKIQPGRMYDEKIAAKNLGEVNIFVRAIIRTYWVDEDGDKDVNLDPALIKFKFDDKDFNTSAWQINNQETTKERKVYYLTNALKPGKTSAPVLNKIHIDGAVLDDFSYTTEVDEETGKTIYTYTYTYDGYRACIEADVQALQPHNINNAIKSSWGVQNVTASGSKLTVK